MARFTANAVWVLCLSLILGACVFLTSSPDLLSLAAGGSDSKFRPGDCVTGNFAFEGEEWVVVERMNAVVETYLVEEVSGRQQAIQVQRIRLCEAPAISRAGSVLFLAAASH